MSWGSLPDYMGVMVLGGLVGFGELVSRYRDDPLSAFKRVAGLTYIALNAAAGAGALAAIRSFGWTFGFEGETAALRLLQILVAGFGAMALFRSSLFVVRAGGQDVAAGPAGFLQVVLDAADRAVDRNQAEERANVVTRLMEAVDFDRAYQALPAYCLALMQNVPPAEQAELAREVARLRGASMTPRAKSLALGLALLNVVGADALKAAVESLGADIRPT